MAWTTPRTWIAGEVPDAAMLNLHVRDNLLYLVGDAAWTAPTLTNGWLNFGSGFTVAGYRKIGDLVWLKGTVKSGTLGAAMFTLPVGFRPLASGQTVNIVESNNLLGRVDVLSTGAVATGGVGSNAYVQLDGIVFSTI